MIYVTGDTHGEYGRIIEFDAKLEENNIIIVCGDFGFIFKNDVQENMILDEIEKRKYTILFVDGNHENFTAINSYPIEMWNGALSIL